MGVSDADSSLEAVQSVLADATDPEDRTSTNLETIDSIFHAVAEDDTISVNQEAFDTATRILSQLQGWGEDNTTRDTLHTLSAQ